MTLEQASLIVQMLRKNGDVWSTDEDFEDGDITLDGTFLEEDLEALLIYMRSKRVSSVEGQN